MVVHVGCGDGRLTPALHASDSFLVHGLDTDARNVEAARKHIQSLGLYGPVSVAQGDGQSHTGNRPATCPMPDAWKRGKPATKPGK